MKKIIKALAVVMAAALLIVSFAACSGSSDANSSSATDATTAETVVQQADDVDYSDVALTIEDGDFDGVEFSDYDLMQNAELDMDDADRD